MARYVGEEVPLSEDDRARARRKEPIDHHHYWNKALDKAVERVPEGDEGPFEVHRYVRVKHESPGWVDGYWVALDTSGG